MSTPDRQLDTRIMVVTPENIAVAYRVAGPFARMHAYLVDVLIRVGIIVILQVLASIILPVSLEPLAEGFLLIAWFAIDWFYGGLFEVLWNGQTPGKRMMNLRVLTVDGQPINALQAILRNVLRSVDSMPIFPWMPAVFLLPNPVLVPCFLVGLFSCALNNRFQRVGDLACGTMVVLEERRRLADVVRFDDPRVASLAASLPAAYVPPRSMAKALAKYIERRKYFSQARRDEIARHLAIPLIERWNLAADTNGDLLLCALYHRTFGGQQQEAVEFAIAN